MTCLYENDLGGERKHRIFRLLGAFPYLLHHHIQPQCLDPAEYKNLKGTKFAIELKDQSSGINEQGHRYYNTHQKHSSDNASNGNILTYMSQKFQRTFRSSINDNKHKYDNNRDQQERTVDDDDTCMVDRRALPWCLLPPSALHKCADSGNRPLWTCDRLSQELTDVGYSDNFTSRERLAFLSLIDKLSKCIGACERIHQTAVYVVFYFGMTAEG